MNNYLPVNPCCTEVVSTTNCNQVYQISNYGCVKNICKSNFPVTSDIVYNGIELTCTLIAPCDTISVVLQKIDAILCSLNNQIISLNEQIVELTENITEAENDITVIFDTLEDCCTTTTTTTLTPTTTTTTTLEECKILKIISEGTDAVYTAIDCTGKIFGEAIPDEGSVVTPCIFPSSVVLFNAQIDDSNPCI
jgi:hypothetical protein